MKKMTQLIEEVDQIVNELNNLSYADQSEDMLILENLDRLESIHQKLGGMIDEETPLSQIKSGKYLH